MSTESGTGPTGGPRRGLWGTLLVAALAWLGLVGGTAAAARFLVSDSSGLAGPAIALGYGVLAALAAAVLGFVLARLLAVARVRSLALAALALTLLSLGILAYRVAVVTGGGP